MTQDESPKPNVATNLEPGADKKAPPAREKAIAFTKPDQIASLLFEAFKQKLPVLIKVSTSAQDTKAIRAVLDGYDSKQKSYRLSQISVAGTELLRGQDYVKVELVLLSKKLVLMSQVTGRTPGKLLLNFPDKIIAIERRLNARFRVPNSQAAFVEFPGKTFPLGSLDTPFLPAFMREEKESSPRLRIDDISLGGIAVFTRFGEIAALFKSEEDPMNAALYFPNHSPIPVVISVRWIKRTQVAITTEKFERARRILQVRFRNVFTQTDIEFKETFYRLGIQFSEVSKDLDSALRQFMRQVQTAETI
jgi:hypothetical protein